MPCSLFSHDRTSWTGALQGILSMCQRQVLTFGHTKSVDHQTALLIQILFTLFGGHHSHSPAPLLQCTSQKSLIFVSSHVLCVVVLLREGGRRMININMSSCQSCILKPSAFNTALHPHLSAPSLSKSTQSCLLGQLSCTVFHVL